MGFRDWGLGLAVGASGFWFRAWGLDCLDSRVQRTYTVWKKAQGLV